MKTLVSIENNSKIIVQDVVIGERYYIVPKEVLPIKYHNDDLYFDKDEYILEDDHLKEVGMVSIEKACDWFKNNANKYIEIVDGQLKYSRGLIINFRKAMEG